MTDSSQVMGKVVLVLLVLLLLVVMVILSCRMSFVGMCFCFSEGKCYERRLVGIHVVESIDSKIQNPSQARMLGPF
jgi:hypothetical protein